MVNKTHSDLALHQETLNQREPSLQERMDRMLNQRRVSMEKEFERRCTKNLEASHAYFHSKTDAPW
jgi:hypothetical protein